MQWEDSRELERTKKTLEHMRRQGSQSLRPCIQMHRKRYSLPTWGLDLDVQPGVDPLKGYPADVADLLPGGGF